jgi:catechol 2,3-dioxygenase-like lactoylglutathione lyase family enzyme
MPKFRRLVPMLQTLDMGRTIAWYEAVLGFRRVGQQDAEWCCLDRDGVSIMFMTNAHLGEPHATATQYFTVDDVDALWDGIKGHCQAEWGPMDIPLRVTRVRHQGP